MSQRTLESAFNPYPPSKVYRLVEPDPIMLVSTGPATKSKPDHNFPDINVMTMGFSIMVQHLGLPLIAACIGP
ncbi:hypothetical protein N657DRAFT_641395 [Parathielavia appendiculata]|uniref:Uncharacterized protein n=1 Tax=Parathielavia appendiculata TaxID=2587402 RepID=A0AAN6U7F9_9PEZI|nr:hypothetical protein N657DRAFT_641395 [Parathielavia appendiculata]